MPQLSSRAARRADFPPGRGPRTRPNNLPGQLTSFIGRERELAQARRLLAQTRLLTLTGAGGTGKTRFALRLANDLLDDFEDGAFFVELASIFATDLVIPTAAQVLGVPDARGRPPLESLKEYLLGKHLLLVLDNVEQVLDIGPRLVELLAACPALTLLVTSRVALRVSGEQELSVPPLELPDLGRRPAAGGELVEAVSRCEAARLFVDRARAIKPDFGLTEENAQPVAEICRRLDGLPLAIELAAAHLRLLSPAAMLARLTSRAGQEAAAAEADEPASRIPRLSPLQLLTGGARDLPVRQQTLRNTIAWSYDLLSPTEQDLFRRLAAFVGGCTLDAAEAAGLAQIGDQRWALAPGEVLHAVESLVARSLLRQVEAAGEPRLMMLETIREFGLERLAQAGELKTMRRWHAGYFLALAEQAEPGLRGPAQRAWLDRLEAEHDNLRAALEWSLAEVRGGEAALRLSGALAWFWASRGYVAEGRRWLDRGLAAGSNHRAPRLKALYGAGWLAHIQRDAPTARRQLEAALALARELDDRWAVAWTLHLLGRVAYFDGDSATARALGEQSLAAARALGDDWLVAWALHLLGLAAHITGDYAAARARYEEALAIRRALGYQEGAGICLTLSGMASFRQGDYAAARALTREGLLIWQELGAYWTVHNGLATLAALAGCLGQSERAVRLAGATAAFGESVDVVPIPLAETMLDQALDAARRLLGEAGYAAAWAAGRAMSLDEAIAEALAVEPRPPTKTAGLPAGLTPREAEVLRLIAAGRTTREIADQLVVSVPTVERHITHIYGKIGARGRADATAFALKYGLG